jgi:hypothetical protein
MFIRKDEQMSHASPTRRGGWDGGSRRRAPRNWYKVVRVLLYALIGLLGGVALLAAVALFLDRNAGTPMPALRPSAPAPSTPTPYAPGTSADAVPPPDMAAPQPSSPQPPPPPALSQDAAGLPPVSVSPLVPPPGSVAPAAPGVPPPAAAAPASEAQPDPAALEALQQQLKEANSTLSGLRAEAEALRRTLADARQARRTPAAPAATAAMPTPPAPAPATATSAPAAPAPAAPAPAAPAPDGWADAERTIQALAQQHTAATPPPSPARAAERAAASPPPPAPAPAPSPADLAANQPPPAPSGPRPRVFLHYPAGSAGGLQTATDIAQRLLFSDFAYADTRSTASAPAESVVRYFYPQDAPAAARLASLLGDGGGTFRIEDDTAHPGRQTPGMLDVWIGR